MTDRKLVDLLNRGYGPVPFIEKWTENSVLAALMFSGGAGNWYHADLIQFRMMGGRRIVDLATIDGGEWSHNSRTAYEIKISKSDFQSDLKKPGKYLEVARHFHRFFFATPKGIVDPHDVPPGLGLIEVRQDTRTRWYGRWRTEVIIQPTEGNTIENSQFASDIIHHGMSRGFQGGARAYLAHYRGKRPEWLKDVQCWEAPITQGAVAA